MSGGDHQFREGLMIADSGESEEHSASVSQWIRGLENNDEQAAFELWNHFFDRLCHQAADRLKARPQAVVGPEDIAASVFESLYRGARAGRFQSVQNRDELWWLLLQITNQKTINYIRRECAQKRTGRRCPADVNELMLQETATRTPTPEYCLILEEEYRRLLELLRDELLREIAGCRLEGYTNVEIAERLGISTATVTRKLRLIRKTWEHELPQ